MYHLRKQLISLHIMVMGFVWFSVQTAIICLKNP
jgi:hypothetical protein